MTNTAGEMLSLMAFNLAMLGKTQGLCGWNEIATSINKIAEIADDLPLTARDCVAGFRFLGREHMKGDSFIPRFGRGAYKSLESMALLEVSKQADNLPLTTNPQRLTTVLRYVGIKLAESTDEYNRNLAMGMIRAADELTNMH